MEMVAILINFFKLLILEPILASIYKPSSGLFCVNFDPVFLRRFCGDFHLLSHFCGDFAAISGLKFGNENQKWNSDFLIRNIEKPFVYGSFSIFSVCDPVGIQTQDLQNRNLTLYSAKLRDLCSKKRCKGTYFN